MVDRKLNQTKPIPVRVLSCKIKNQNIQNNNKIKKSLIELTKVFKEK